MVPAFDDEKLAEAQETLQRHGGGKQMAVIKMMEPHYSGKLSTPFWKKVHKLSEKNCNILYKCGCLLQNMEGDILQTLQNAEKEEWWRKYHGRKRTCKS